MISWHIECKYYSHHSHFQWLAYKLPQQLIYVTYRWMLVLYFLIWLVLAGTSQGNGKYFIYLTNWAHISYNTYLIIAALSTTWRIISTHWNSAREGQTVSVHNDYLSIAEPSDYWNLQNNRLSWYQMVHWVFYSIGNELALCIMILYWSFLYRGEDVDGVNANTHLLNGVLSLVDMWISGLPINFLHVIYILVFSAVYSVFSGLYFIATGDIIYSVLDYESNAGAAVGLYLALTFLLLPLVHLLVYLMYLGKQWVVYHACAVRHAPLSSEQQEVELANLRAQSPSDTSESS